MNSHVDQLSRSNSSTDAAFEAFVDDHQELASLAETSRQLGARSLELLPFGVDLTVNLTPGEVGTNETQTNMGGKTDHCIDN